MRLSRLPKVIGACVSDLPTICQYVNGAQRRLLMCKEAMDEGWYGTFAEIAFNVSREEPYITMPRGIARIEAVNICNDPIPVQNQFFEYLQFGNGRLPKCRGSCRNLLQVYSRNNAVTFTDLTGTAKYVRVYVTNAADVGRRIFFSGIDNNSVVITSQDGVNRVPGLFLTMASPFVTSTTLFSRITGIQKDVTAGDVQVFSFDPADGTETLLLTMEPGETTAWYRRYYINNLPRNCCGDLPSTQTVQVTAIAKLDLVPAVVDTDYLLIQNPEALIEEASAIRYSEVDSSESKAMSQQHHKEAIRYLMGELTHFLGKDSPAFEFAPFGSARLEKQGIGTQI